MFKKILYISLCVIMSVSFTGVLSAFALEYFVGTPDEILKVKGSNPAPLDVFGAITMYEGQTQATLDFNPDNNDEDDLGEYDRAWQDVYASGTLQVGGGSTLATSTFDNLRVADNVMVGGGNYVCESDGTNCATVGSSAMWTNSGAYWYYASSTVSDRVGIGDTSPDASLDIDVAVDQNHLILQGHSTQNQDIMQVRNNAGTSLVAINNSGNIYSSGTITIAGAGSVTGALTTGGGIVSDTTNTDDLGSNSVSFKDLYTSGTIYAANISIYNNADIIPDTNNVSHLGAAATAWANLFTSGTAYMDTIQQSSASVSSTFAGYLDVQGNVQLGDATSDRVALTGYLSSNIIPDANEVRSLGAYANALQHVYASGTVFADYFISEGSTTSTFDGSIDVGGNIQIGDATSDTISITSRFTTDLNPETANVRDLGASTLLWKDIYASGTVYTGLVHAKGGSTATSTFSTNVLLNEGAAATSTLQIGENSAAGYGGCIVLSNGNGTGMLYLFYDGNSIATSTDSQVCY